MNIEKLSTSTTKHLAKQKQQQEEARQANFPVFLGVVSQQVLVTASVSLSALLLVNAAVTIQHYLPGVSVARRLFSSGIN